MKTNFFYLLLISITMTMTSFTLPPLPYDYHKLEPVISAETLTYHHDKHHQAYVNNLNKLIEGTKYADMSLENIIRNSDGGLYNNAAQTWNHTFYFGQFGDFSPIEGSLAEAIIKEWGSIDAFKAKFTSEGNSLFGSGWVWLAIDPTGKLSIVKYSNAGNPLSHGLIPLLGIDVWEHSYYIDYRNNRAAHLDALWSIIDWRVIEERYNATK